MSLGERIEARRKEIGLSQAELARRVGVRQSTMNSLIKGDSRTTRSLFAIARELRTTPAFLSGETDDPESALPDAPQLDRDERELVDLVREIDPADRRALVQIARSLAHQRARPTLHAPRQEYRAA